MTIPDQYRVGHEAHFAQVTNRFFDYLRHPETFPAWENPNMLAKYSVTTRGVDLSRRLAFEQSGNLCVTFDRLAHFVAVMQRAQRDRVPLAVGQLKYRVRVPALPCRKERRAQIAGPGVCAVECLEDQ